MRVSRVVREMWAVVRALRKDVRACWSIDATTMSRIVSRAVTEGFGAGRGGVRRRERWVRKAGSVWWGDMFRRCGFLGRGREEGGEGGGIYIMCADI